MCAGTWWFDDNILLREAPSRLKAAEKMANSMLGERVRSLVLSDNMSALLAFWEVSVQGLPFAAASEVARILCPLSKYQICSEVDPV